MDKVGMFGVNHHWRRWRRGSKTSKDIVPITNDGVAPMPTSSNSGSREENPTTRQRGYSRPMSSAGATESAASETITAAKQQVAKDSVITPRAAPPVNTSPQSQTPNQM